ncbi:hypothetical protein HBH98_001150 [Parastagonospora nodorum]|nr:hypothetical protein HBH53_176460 [Parastagonospora nodorum]KAH3970355.1 hypothetical protein HBH52_168170 [Parastagonospora nodorum]KAH3972016.1 hypothetical protein HBH51_105040 [Parastagonospora nodorum]KAH3996850.1 hypothetical protein HBI10_150710 [Parastagonospora nodorum]KAH4009161.1 hypothetical protein HBI13_224780 [Parastagonospora nodorum]
MAEGDTVKSPFLRLPREVRNLIYAYTTETSTVALHGPTRPDGHQEPAPIAHAQWPHLKR